MNAYEKLERAVCELGGRATSVREFRSEALALLAGVIRFDGALYHELSPRVGLESAALIGVDLAALEGGRGSWDENAVLFARLRELALSQGGVATDRDAFPPASRARRAWEERVAKPFGARAAVVGHLVVREKIVAGVMLFRRTAAPFSTRDQTALRELLPALAVCDALQQALASKPLGGAIVQLRCVDQRLTSRQRELVERVALGHTNREIGEALGLSENTVRNLLTEVRRRLAAANRAEIVRLAVLR